MMDAPLEYIGRIARLQIQRSSLKQGEKPARYYDPTPLLRVEELVLTPTGAVARDTDAGLLYDVHNAEHPDTRNHDGINNFSIGFTSHYEHMRSRYGIHLTNGIAGENILIDGKGRITLEDIRHGIAIRRSTDGRMVRLVDVSVAHPCVEFSHFALCRQRGEASNDEIKQTLQYLDDGIRGFYCILGETEPLTVATGDEVYAILG